MKSFRFLTCQFQSSLPHDREPKALNNPKNCTLIIIQNTFSWKLSKSKRHKIHYQIPFVSITFPFDCTIQLSDKTLYASFASSTQHWCFDYFSIIIQYPQQHSFQFSVVSNTMQDDSSYNKMLLCCIWTKWKLRREEEEASRFTLDATFEFHCIISLTNIIKYPTNELPNKMEYY